MAVQLTERQQEIKGLLEQGLSASAIAKKLNISTNAIYQQIRRIRAAGGKVGTSNGGSKGKASGGRQSSRTQAAAPPAPKPQAEQRVATPLQAIRARRSEIEAELKASASELLAANKAAEAAKEAHAKREQKHGVELTNLEAAERAVKGEKPKAARKRPSRAKSGSGSKGSASASKGSSGSQGGAQATNGGSPEAKSGEGEKQEQPATA